MALLSNRIFQELPHPKRLHIGTCGSSCWCIEYWLPLHSLTGFWQLQSLSLPQKAVLGNDHGIDLMTFQPSSSSILPRTLRHLKIDFPSVAIFAFLNRLHQERQNFPDLKTVVLNCDPDHRGSRFASDDGTLWQIP